MSDSDSHKKVANSLVALSSAAVLAVYTAGYLHTKSAADRFAVQAARRLPVTPAPAAPSKIDAPRPANDHIAPPAPTRAPASANRTTKRPARRDADTRRPDGSARAANRILSAPAVTVVAAPATAPLPSPSTTPSEVPAPLAEPAAVVPPSAPTAPLVPAKPIYKDGTYYGWGTSRHGDIQAAVVIQDGRIASATIAQCLTRYSCSVIAKLPPQVAERQSPETDYVSGATQSTNAFYYAVVEALSKAK